MVWMIVMGVIAVVMGVVLIASPKTLVNWSDQMNRMVTRIDEQVLKYHVSFGICIVAAGIFFFVYAYMEGLR